MNRIHLIPLAVLMTTFGGSSVALSQTQSYEFTIRAANVPMFQQLPEEGALETHTNYGCLDLDFDLDDYTGQICGPVTSPPISTDVTWGDLTNIQLPGGLSGLGALGGPFSHRFLPSFGVDLTSVGGPNVSILEHPIGYDIDLSGGVDFSVGMDHAIDTGRFDIQIPFRVDVVIDDFNRGRITRIALDSAFSSTPQIIASAPEVKENFALSGRIHGSGVFSLYTGPFGAGQYDYELFSFDEERTVNLFTAGSHSIGGTGLIINPENAVCDAGEYSYSEVLAGSTFSGKSNLAWQAVAPLYCLGGDLATGLGDDAFLLEFYDATAPGNWHTTGDAMSFNLPSNVSAVLSRPSNALVQTETNSSTGEMSAHSTAPVLPHMDLTFSLHSWVRAELLSKCRSSLLAGTPIFNANAPGSPDNCKKFAAVDLMSTHSSLLLSPFSSATGRVSVQGTLSNLNQISTTFGGANYSMGNWDIWYEHDVLDFEAHVNVEHQLDARFTPEVRVKLHFPQPIQYRMNPGDAWETGAVVDMPIEGEFEVQTDCGDYDLAFIPEFYVTQDQIMVNEATDEYAVELELEALQFNVGMSELDIIPAFSFEFPCAGSVGEFFESSANCLASVMAPIANNACTSPCYTPGVCTQIGGGCTNPCGNWGNCGWCWPSVGGQGSSQCQSCVTALTCFQNSYECTLCNYGFPGLTIPEFNLAEALGSGAVNDFGNKVLGFNEVWTVARTSDRYLTREWSVEGFAAVDSMEAAFIPDSTKKAASLFTTHDVVVRKAAISPGSPSGVLSFEGIGGTAPLYASGQSTTLEVGVTIPLDQNREIALQSGRYPEFTITDASGCLSDTPSGFSTELESNLAVPYVAPDTFGFCSDVDGDGCDDCASGTFDPSNDGADHDGDGLCNLTDSDDDNDGVLDGNDPAPLNPYSCGDSDGDGCDDCNSGTFDPENDGSDLDGDGFCDENDNDADGDGLNNIFDAYPNDPSLCGSHDGDGCDDCTSGTYDPANDGADFDGDGLCDESDDDDDNDGRLDALDVAPHDPFACGDSDGDGCDDCASGTFDPANDGLDADGDGICDDSDEDLDNDGRTNGEDTDPTNPNACGDTDGDGCQDCISGTFDPANDGADFDGDGMCDLGDSDIDGDGVENGEDLNNWDPSICGDEDADGCDDCSAGEQLDHDGDGVCNEGDEDDDNDGILDASDPEPFNNYLCGDFDLDGCDDCTSGTYNPFNDGDDLDGDGICDFSDNDADGDGLLADSGGPLNDSDDLNPLVCSDWDQDGCDDCSSGTFDMVLDGPNDDGDLFCNDADNCSDSSALNWSDAANEACTYGPEVSAYSFGPYDAASTLVGYASGADGEPVLSVGVKFGTSVDLAVADSISEPFTNHDFSFQLDSLMDSTTYYYSVFATNQWGTSWTDTMNFTTYGPPMTCGEPVLTFEGAAYETVQINGQCWFAENLRTATYANGDSIIGGLSDEDWADLTTGAQGILFGDSANLSTKGRLYNFHAVQDPRGLCPAGWHVPGYFEWLDMLTYLGGWENVAEALKEIAPYWDGTNAAGFSARPGGVVWYTGESEFWNNGVWWVSSQIIEDNSAGLLYSMEASSSTVTLYNAGANLGGSVRCMQTID